MKETMTFINCFNLTSKLTVLFLTSLLYHYSFAFNYEEMAEFFQHTGASGTQHGKSDADPDYYESNSGIPHLPSLSGFMGTHGTYRFLSIHEQTAVLIGDGKHGVWRIQENGFIREYRKFGMKGLPPSVDPNDINEQTARGQMLLKIIDESYSHYIPEEGWTGYKYPDDKISNGKADNMTGFLNFIDLTIYHPKYGGKYEKHVAIDLPQYFCTMTQNDYKHLGQTWKYAVAQPRANTIGPLGIRAGFGIKENYHNVLRFDFFADAGVWANIGVGKRTDFVVKNVHELRSRDQTVNYQRVDMNMVDVEAYLYERPFFNKPYIFITFVMDTKSRNEDYTYIRPHGAYYEELLKRNMKIKNTKMKHFPNAYVENYPVRGQRSLETAYGLPVYGHHHPARHEHSLIGGACPNRGGDWGRYPWSNGGSGFPTNYEEVTPMCDGFVLDMKLWINLQVESWNDVNLFLGNAGTDGSQMNNYTADANIYGRYTDPYLIRRRENNPYEMDLTNDGKIIEPKDDKLPYVTFKINFGRIGTYLGFNEVSLSSKKEDTSSFACSFMSNCFLVLVLNFISTFL